MIILSFLVDESSIRFKILVSLFFSYIILSFMCQLLIVSTTTSVMLSLDWGNGIEKGMK